MPITAYNLGEDGSHLSGGESFHQFLQKFVSRYVKDPQRGKLVRESLLGHPYLRIDERERAEERHRKERYKKAEEKVKLLLDLLDKGEVVQEIPSGITGQRELTREKLSAVHKPKFLDFGDDWLLIELERHPEGGKSGPIHQFWLFSGNLKKVILLPYSQQEISVVFGEEKVDNGDGIWRTPSETNRSSFEKKLKEELGHKAVKEFFRVAALDTRAALIESIPTEIDVLCERITGFVPSNIETSARADREKIYESKYGPTKGNGISISTQGMKFFGKIERI